MARPVYDPDRPFGMLRMATYKKVVESFDKAKKVLSSRNLVYGEPAAVPYYKDDVVYLAVGIGTPIVGKPLILTNFSVECGNMFGDNISDDLDGRKVGVWKEYIEDGDSETCEDDGCYWSEFDDKA